MWPLLKPLLFSLEPETAHGVSLNLLELGGSSGLTRGLIRALYGPGAAQPVEAFGLRFPNALGLAAGYDKEGRGWRGLAAMGFGHVEVGTITPLPQAGNPKPRVFRLPEDRCLVNRMGFPSSGADAAVPKLAGGDRPEGVILGANLGKNKATPLEEAAGDYVQLIQRFAPLADYLVVNVSSPNTPKLRELQSGPALHALLKALHAARLEQVEGLGRPVPLLVKLAPDLDDEQLDDALDAITAQHMDGVIATNTTISREGLRSPNAKETGGMSGAALTTRANDMCAAIHRRTQGQLPIVGVGGIMGPDDAKARLDAGATLVQVWTGLIYGGPGLVRRIVQAL